MSKLAAYKKVRDCIETSISFVQLETSHNMLILFKKKYSDEVMNKRLISIYESATLKLCGN